MIVGKEKCKIGYEKRLIFYKKTVNVCNEEFTPLFSMRRSFDHQ